MNMKNKALVGIVVLAFMLGGCHAANDESKDGAALSPTTNVSEQTEIKEAIQPTIEPTSGSVEENHEHTNGAGSDQAGEQQSESSEELHIIIDQTEKPIEGDKGSFDFVVKKRPEGYALSSMEWNSPNYQVENSVQEALQHGMDGEDGFYISGNGQFMGFFYDRSLVGETGTVSFTFSNEQGEEVTWSKEITLL